MFKPGIINQRDAVPILKPIRGIRLNRTHPLARGLVGLWIFNEGSGNKVFDLSGNNNIGTFQGTAPSWSAGKFGSAVLLPGTDEYIDCGSVKNLSAANIGDEITLVALVNPGSLGSSGTGDNPPIISKDDGPGVDREWMWRFEGTDGLYFRTIGGNNGGTPDVWTMGEWQLAVVVWNVGTNIITYRNGLKIDDTVEVNTSAISAQPVYVGRLVATVDGFYTGKIAMIMIYNRALSAFEIAFIYREPFSMVEAPGKLHLNVLSAAAISRYRHVGFKPIVGADRLRGLLR